MGDEENRVHARIHVSTTITVASPDGNIEATLRDLSKGGARFAAPRPLGGVGETIELFLPSLTGEDITVMAEIIRSTEGPDGQHTVAVRFDAVDPPAAQRPHGSAADGDGRGPSLVPARVAPHGHPLRPARRAARHPRGHF